MNRFICKVDSKRIIESVVERLVVGESLGEDWI